MNDPHLIIGINSLIGSSMFKRWKSEGKSVWGSSRHAEFLAPRVFAFDLSRDIEEQWPFRSQSFAVALICAGVGGERNCAEDPKGTAFVNVRQTLELTEMLYHQGTFVIVIGSSHIFDGQHPLAKPDDPISPQGEYGRQKAAVEPGVLAAGGAVIRSTKVFHKGLHTLAHWRSADVPAFTNYHLSPVSLSELTDTVSLVAAHRKPGVYHASSPDQICYAQLADIVGIPVQKRSVLPSDNIHNPAHTTLDTATTTSLFGIEFEDAETCIRRELAR